MAFAIRPKVCHGDGTPIPEWIPDGTEHLVEVSVLDPRRQEDMEMLWSMSKPIASLMDDEMGA